MVCFTHKSSQLPHGTHPSTDFSWIMYQISAKRSYCVLFIWQGLGGPRMQQGGQRREKSLRCWVSLRVKSGWVDGGMKSHPWCFWPVYLYHEPRDEWFFPQCCVICLSIIGKSLSTSVFRCRWLLASVLWVFFFLSLWWARMEIFHPKSFDVILRTLNFMQPFPWRLKKLF